MNDYNEKLQKLQEDFDRKKLSLDHEYEVKELIPEIKHNAWIPPGGREPWISVELQNQEEFKKVHELFPPTNTEVKVGTAGNDGYHIDRPYRINTTSNIRQANHLEIQYHSGNKYIRMTLPIQLVGEFLRGANRPVTDSEYHYFGGVSMKEIRNMNIACYNFLGEQVTWYGGHRTCLDSTQIDNIISFLNS